MGRTEQTWAKKKADHKHLIADTFYNLDHQPTSASAYSTINIETRILTSRLTSIKQSIRSSYKLTKLEIFKMTAFDKL
jgi:hypothetical protein